MSPSLLHLLVLRPDLGSFHRSTLALGLSAYAASITRLQRGYGLGRYVVESKSLRLL